MYTFIYFTSLIFELCQKKITKTYNFARVAPSVNIRYQVKFWSKGYCSTWNRPNGVTWGRLKKFKKSIT